MVNAPDIRVIHRRMRKRARISQDAAGEMIGVSRASISVYENGGDLPLEYTPDEYGELLERLIAERRQS